MVFAVSMPSLAQVRECRRASVAAGPDILQPLLFTRTLQEIDAELRADAAPESTASTASTGRPVSARAVRVLALLVVHFSVFMCLWLRLVLFIVAGI